MKWLWYVSLYASSRGNQDAYDTNKMAEEFTHFFLDQAFSVGQQVQEFCKKKCQRPQRHFCGVMDVTVINLGTCQYYTCLIFHFEFFQQGIHKDQSHRLVCHFFVLTTFWRGLWSITELMHSTMESINFVNQ